MLTRTHSASSCCLAVDSDGCVFDSMRVKQKSCFIPRLIETWNLEPWGKIIFAEALHLNLHSEHRGENRFKVLLALFKLLQDDSRLRDSPLPKLALEPLQQWTESSAELSLRSLEKALDSAHSPILRDALRWTRAVNQDIAALPPASPFPEAAKALRAAHQACEVQVVSSANRSALEREWEEAELKDAVHKLNGQEQGRKESILRETAGRFGRVRVLMVGDAPPDHQAATRAGVLFFPIHPGREDQDWHFFRTELLPSFLEGKPVDAQLAAQLSSWQETMKMSAFSA